MSKIDCPSSNINETLCFKTYNIQNVDVNVVEIDLSNMLLNHDYNPKMKQI